MKAHLVDNAERVRLLSVFKDEEIVKLTADLIAIPTHRKTERKETDCAVFIRDVFRNEGIPVELVDVDCGRCNVIARLPGRGGGPSLMFNGHTDVVPPGEMPNAFDPRIVDGKLYGRGASDMKGGVACQVYAMLALKRAGIALDGDVVFTGVIAEEDGTSLGSVNVIEHGPSAEMVVVAEPSGLETIVAHKGFDYYAIDVVGTSAHSSQPENGVNAIYKAARVLHAVETRLIPETAQFTHSLLGPPSINVSGVLGAARTEESLIRGVSEVQKLPGGTVPDFCRIHFDRRRVPGETLDGVLRQFEQLLEALREEDPSLCVEVSFLPGGETLPTHPPLDTSPDAALVRSCLAASEAIVGNAPIAKGVPFWSDAAIFNDRLGVPAIVYGPGYIDQAHSTDEFVPLDHLYKAARVFALLAAGVVGRA